MSQQQPSITSPMALLGVMDYAHPRLTNAPQPQGQFAVHRHASRAVVLDDSGQVYMLRQEKYQACKLAGGGIDPGETPESALLREVLEELGFVVKITHTVGSFVQYDYEEGFRQDSYCYLARIVGGDGVPKYSANELKQGCSTQIFASLDETISAMENAEPVPHKISMVTRDLLLLRSARDIIES